MANYDLTYEGSRVQGILDTGDELQTAGYIFRGEATPSTVPGTPTERVVYIGGPGTYNNFGGSITVGAGCICVFKYTGSAWSNQVINTGLSDAISSAINSEATTRSEADTALQNAINSEATTRSEADTALQNAITAINNNIGNGYVFAGVAIPSTSPVTGKVFYLAVQAGTYTNFEDSEETPLAVTAGINILKNTGTGWVLDQVISIDAEPTQGSANLVKSGGVLNSIIQNGPAFDLSAYNAQEGVLATYADLSAALTALNALPADFKQPGMSFKFVLTSDNKYIQARCMAQNFTTDVTQWQGVDDEPTAGSKNLVESGGVEKQVSPLKETLRTGKQLDSFYITDLEGNVVARINASGIQAVEFLIKNGTTLTELLNGKVNVVAGKGLSTNDYTTTDKDKLSALPTNQELQTILSEKASEVDLEEVKSIVKSDYNDEFYITDADGYIILKATANGVEYVKPSGGEIDTSDIKNNAVTEPKIKDGAVTQAKTNLLKGYTLYSIGDSLSVWGYWQERIAALTGCIFDNSKNIDANYPISISGKSSYGLTFENLLWQAKNLISQNVITNQGENTIIILENGNDQNQTQTFDKAARTYIPGNVVDAGLLADFSNTVLQNIPSAQRTLNTVLKVLAVKNGTNLKITTLPTREGDVSIYTQNATGHSTHYIHVIPQATPQATMEYVLDKILEYSYLGIEDTLGADRESVNFANQLSDNTDPEVVFEDVDNTGMQVAISHTEDARKSYAMYFKGTSIEDAQWAVTSNWQQGITFSEGIKSGLQLLKTTYPKAKIFMTMFPLFNAVQSDFLNANGTYDHNAFYNTDYDTKCRALLEAYKEVATFYNIPLINVRDLCNINLDNMNEYYYNNNPHPKNRNCYNPIADVIAKQLITYLV